MRTRLSRVLAIGCASTVLLAHPASAQDEPPPAEIAAPASAVVNEVSTIGHNGSLDEAIELRNKTGHSVDVTNWVVKIYNVGWELIQTIPLAHIGETIELAPFRSVGDTLVLTGAEFFGTVRTPHATPVNFRGLEGIPVRSCVGLFPSTAPTARPIDSVCFGTPWPRSPGPLPLIGEGPPAAPEDPLTGVLGGSNSRDINSRDTNNNRADFSLQERSF